jgi:tetratricopeptide (TPR) repeat protein
MQGKRADQVLQRPAFETGRLSAFRGAIRLKISAIPGGSGSILPPLAWSPLVGRHVVATPTMNASQKQSRTQTAPVRQAVARPGLLAAGWHWPTVLAGAALMVMVVAAYRPALDAEFIWDDETNVTNNETLRSLDGLRQMWFVPRSIQQYYPLMYTTYWVEYRLWGLRPFGYHLVNILLHGAAVLLTWRVLRRLEVPGAWLAAAIFTVHPVEVESVAWVTERKNVLSLSLALLSMLAYLRFEPAEPSANETTSDRNWWWYGAALALFALALFAKTVVVTLPAVLLVIYWWKRGRITGRDVALLLPFFALSVAMGLVTRAVEMHQVGAQGAQWSLTPLERTLLAGRALWFYAAKLAWPSPLMLFYPYFSIDAHQWWQYLFPLAALALPIILWRVRGKVGRGPLAAVLIYCGVLLPALGFFNIYFMKYAHVSDHFQYHASVALIALAAAGVALVAARLKSAERAFVYAGSGAVLALLAILAYRQTFIYHDLETLYRDTIAKNPDAWMAYLNLATHFDAIDRDAEAVEIARAGLQVKPDEPKLHACLANVIGQLSEVHHDPAQRQEAIAHYQEAVRLDPTYTDVYNCLGFMELNTNPSAAVVFFRRSLQYDPVNAAALYGLGAVDGMANRWPEAQQHFEQALASNPRLTDAQRGLSVALTAQGKKDAALAHLTRVVELDPSQAEMHFELANLLVARNDFAKAVLHYSEAVKLRPNYVDALQNLGAALLQMGDFNRAIPYLERTLQLDPNNEQARSNLAQIRDRRSMPTQP